MISALLLPLFLGGTPAGIGGAPRGDPPIRLWINNDGRFLRGDHAKVQVRTEYDGYLIVLHVDPEGYLRVLFPLDPDEDNFVRGGKKYEVRGRGGREAFEADGKGGGTVYAAVSHESLRFDGFVMGDHWDYRALAPSRLSNNPEAELNELVRRMAQENFDYDLLSYQVIESVVYASDYSYVPSNFAISADLFFGRPFRPFDSPFLFAFDPFFDPFLFDPFFHRGFFVDPFFNPFFFDRFVHRGFFFDPFVRRRFFFDPFLDPFVHQRFFFDPFFDPFGRRRFFFDPFFRRQFFHHPVLVDRFLHRPFLVSPRGLASVPFRDRRGDFRRGVTTADLTPWRARGAATAIRGRRVEVRSGRPSRLAVADARRPAIEARRDNWPVDVSPRRREAVIEARRDNWPVDVSPRRREAVTQARRNNWPVDVSPRRQLDRTPLPEARRAWRIEDRPGLEMLPPARGGRESFSTPSDRGSDGGSWWPRSDRGGDRGFAPFARPSNDGGRGVSRRR
jgi:hypothetical protein